MRKRESAFISKTFISFGKYVNTWKTVKLSDLIVNKDFVIRGPEIPKYKKLYLLVEKISVCVIWLYFRNCFAFDVLGVYDVWVLLKSIFFKLKVFYYNVFCFFFNNFFYESRIKIGPPRTFSCTQLYTIMKLCDISSLLWIEMASISYLLW